MTKSDVTKILDTANNIKPADLFIDELKWKYLLWAVLMGKNVLILGPTRCGKTKAVQSAVKALNRDKVYFYFNMGSTQDARATLIGNTFFKKDVGTFFSQSSFVKAIRTPNAVIHLDELTRGHHDAWNILMSVIDPTQRYLRLDESEGSEVVPVASGVSFISTANVGTEYTATKVLDKAVSSRFPVKIEMEPLSKKDELELLKVIHPDATNDELETFVAICDIAQHTRQQIKKDDSKISTFIPTGAVVEMAELVSSGFSLSEIAEVSIYPDFNQDGGTDSERTYVKQLVQKHIKPTNVKNPINDPAKKNNPVVPDNEVPF